MITLRPLGAQPYSIAARSFRARVILVISALTLLGLALGCKSDQGQPPVQLALPQEESLGELEDSRAELVSRADHLAISAHKKSGEAAASLLVQAAQLRESAYLMDGKQVDALEAVELWSDATSLNPKAGCDYGLRAAGLKAQLGAEPEKQFRELYLLRETYGEGSCRARVSRALAVLARYEPTPEVLRELRNNAKGLAAEVESTGQEGNVPLDAPQEVVVPAVLRASLDRPTKITKVEPFGADRTARVVVHVTHPTKFQVGTLAATNSQGPRLFVDIEHASHEGDSVIESKGLLKRVRLGKKKDATRIVLDLKERVYHRVFYLPEPFRLVMDLSTEEPSTQAAPRKIRRVVLDPGHGGHDPGAIGPNGLQEKDVLPGYRPPSSPTSSP